MYRGKRYVVSCRQLGIGIEDQTKEGSYRSANAWWAAKLAEIEARPTVIPEWQIDLKKRIDWVDKFDAKNPDRIAAVLSLSDAAWETRLQAVAVESPPIDMTIMHHVTRYLDLEQARVNAGQLSGNQFDLTRRCLEYFSNWLGPQASVQTINPDRWEGYWLHLTTLDCSVDYKLKRFQLAKCFVTWMGSKGVFHLPANLLSRKYRFGSSVKAIPTLSVMEVTTLIEGAAGQLKLHLMLMLNCGYTQVDVSDLRRDEVDLKAGTITRKRSKTADEATVPTVTYKLWRSTLALLKQHIESEGDLALRTRSNTAWVVRAPPALLRSLGDTFAQRSQIPSRLPRRRSIHQWHA